MRSAASLRDAAVHVATGQFAPTGCYCYRVPVAFHPRHRLLKPSTSLGWHAVQCHPCIHADYDPLYIRFNEDDTYGDGNNYEVALSRTAADTWRGIQVGSTATAATCHFPPHGRMRTCPAFLVPVTVPSWSASVIMSMLPAPCFPHAGGGGAAGPAAGAGGGPRGGREGQAPLQAGAQGQAVAEHGQRGEAGLGAGWEDVTLGCCRWCSWWSVRPRHGFRAGFHPLGIAAEFRRRSCRVSACGGVHLTQPTPLQVDIEEATVRPRRDLIRLVVQRKRREFHQPAKLADKDAHEQWNSSQMECRPFKVRGFGCPSSLVHHVLRQGAVETTSTHGTNPWLSHALSMFPHPQPLDPNLHAGWLL